MRANLSGLDDLPWHTFHTNHGTAEKARVPRLLRICADAAPGTTYPPYRSPYYLLGDILCHQGSRFGGAAETLPFLIELAEADETAERPALLRLAAEIGAPLGWEADVPFDREVLCSISEEELWAEDSEHVDAAGAMWAVDARNTWVGELDRVSRLLEDESEPLRLAAMDVLLEESTVPAQHETRLVRCCQEDGSVAWHAAIALGFLGVNTPLADETLSHLRSMLADETYLHRLAAAIGLVLGRPDSAPVSGPVSEAVIEVLRESVERHAELSAETSYAFSPSLPGIAARARHAVGL